MGVFDSILDRLKLVIVIKEIGSLEATQVSDEGYQWLNVNSQGR